MFDAEQGTPEADELELLVALVELYEKEKYPIEYQEIKKEKYGNNQFCLQYTKTNIYNEPYKMIPLINKKGMKKVDSFGVIEVPIPPIRIISQNYIDNVKN